MANLQLTWNQQIKNGNFVDNSNWGPVLSPTAQDNVLTISYGGTAEWAASADLTFRVQQGHIYYSTIELKAVELGSSIGLYFWNKANAAVLRNITQDFVKFERITNYTWEGDKNFQFMFGTTGVAQAKKLMVVDLTLMFGAGNEPTTVAEVKRLCKLIGKDLDTYQEYNTGEVIEVKGRLTNQLIGKEVAGWKNAGGSPLVKMTNLNTGKYIEFEQEVENEV